MLRDERNMVAAARRDDVPEAASVSRGPRQPRRVGAGEALNASEMPGASAVSFGPVGGPAQPGQDRPATNLVRNRPSLEGRALGAELARFADVEIAKLGTDLRCRSCAFRAGTVPNGCLPTVGDALKCSMEGVPFWCHERSHLHCAGWAALCDPTKEPVLMPYPFSDEQDENDA